MAFYYKPALSIIFLSTNLLVLCLILLISESATSSYTLNLIHRDSPLSPFYNPFHTQLHRQRSSFLRSIARSSSKLSSPITPFSGEYLTKFRIGTPPIEVLAIVDTHSALTWTQCQPCKNNSTDNGCYKQKTPLFDPRKCNTYRNLSCGSDECALLDDAEAALYPACYQDQQPCTYYVFYKDDTNTHSGGDIAVETLTFDDGDSAKVVFGCGRDNMGMDFVEKASGVLGLGRGSVSIADQLLANNSISGGAKYFSYCLTPESESDSGASSKIRFGSDAVVMGNKVVSTSLKKGKIRSFYTVTLEGISVGNQRLEYSSNPKRLKRNGNIVIDSSTAMTVLTTSFYDQLESALIKALVNGTTAKRVPDPRKTNGLCYEKGGQVINFPPITAHFEGADLVLSNENTFLQVGKGVYCLTFLRGINDDPSNAIFGSIHQSRPGSEGSRERRSPRAPDFLRNLGAPDLGKIRFIH